MNMKRRLTLGVVIASAAVLGACSGGDTDGGKASDVGFDDDVFVSGPDTTGSITVDVVEPEMEIGETSGFIVSARNASGQPVRNIQVACDSERGVAIIEPLRGFELTDDNGTMSGRIGCERPGSFQFVCRLTTGANRRAFVGVKCRGEVPAGFQGFPGAAGGGLGGGVQVNDDGEVRIVEIGFDDDGSIDTGEPSVDVSVDTIQTPDCTPSTTEADPEPFFNTYVNIKVENNLSEKVRFSTLRYSISNLNDAGEDFSSRPLSLVRESGSTLDANGDTKNIIVPIFVAKTQAGFAGLRKAPADGTQVGPYIEVEGLRTINFVLEGENASGDVVSVRASTTVSFANIDRCG
jgi:hypothetical protein